MASEILYSVRVFILGASSIYQSQVTNRQLFDNIIAVTGLIQTDNYLTKMLLRSRVSIYIQEAKRNSK